MHETPVRAMAEPLVRYLPDETPTGMARAVLVQSQPLVQTRQLSPLDGEGRLVGEGSADQQIDQVLANLQAVLQAAGSGLDRLVKLNIYADSPQTVELVRRELSERIDAAVRPVTTAVVSPLPHPQALVAVDALAIAAKDPNAVALQRCEAVAGEDGFADASLVPAGGAVYLSGQAEKGPRIEATSKSLNKLLETIEQLELERSQVSHLKVFIDSAAAADEVLAAVKRLFPEQLTPPVVFVEWIASAPIEIEAVVHLPLTGARPAERVRFYTPPGVNPSPVFSRVAIVDCETHVYISGLSARQPGDAEAQVRDVFAQLEHILSETGTDLRQLAKATYYVSNDETSAMLGKLRPQFYDPERPPAASLAKVHRVGRSDRTVTMDMIAVSRAQEPNPSRPR